MLQALWDYALWENEKFKHLPGFSTLGIFKYLNANSALRHRAFGHLGKLKVLSRVCNPGYIWLKDNKNILLKIKHLPGF